MTGKEDMPSGGPVVTGSGKEGHKIRSTRPSPLQSTQFTMPTEEGALELRTNRLIHCRGGGGGKSMCA